MKRSIILAVVIVLWMLFVTSCGSRKVENKTVQVEDKSTVQVVDKLDTKTETKTNINIMAESDTFEYTPIDNRRPITINGKTYLNARIKASNSKVVSNIKIDETETKKAVKTVEQKNDIKEVVKDKKTEKKDYSALYLGATLILLAVLMYFKFK